MSKLKLFFIISITTLLLAFTNPEIDIEKSPYSSLFKIERSKDKNQIFYDVNLNNLGVLDPNNPISIYWRRNTEGGVIKPLTWIQKKYAYGLNFINVNDEYATFKFVSYDKMVFTLKRKANNQFEVYTKYKGNLLKIERIFIQIHGGSFWFPKITGVEIYAQNIKTGTEVIEIITP